LIPLTKYFNFFGGKSLLTMKKTGKLLDMEIFSPLVLNFSVCVLFA
jgi:hypothetical protein